MNKKVALITGASRGIGLAVAKRFAKEGYDLALAARSFGELQKLADALSAEFGISAKAYALDVADKQAVKSVVADVVADFSRIDVLFNNAGVVARGTSELSDENFELMIHINLMGAFYVMKAVAAQMKQQRSGYIFNLVSRSALQARDALGGYAASKFGLRGMSEAMARELAAFNIKVTALHPGWVQTNMTKDISACPGSEMIQPEDIAEVMVCFLNLSSHAHVRDILIEPRAVL